MERLCEKCGLVKPLDAAHWHKWAVDAEGFFRHCKVCRNAYNREKKRAWVKKNPVRFEEQQLASRYARTLGLRGIRNDIETLKRLVGELAKQKRGKG